MAHDMALDIEARTVVEANRKPYSYTLSTRGVNTSLADGDVIERSRAGFIVQFAHRLKLDQDLSEAVAGRRPR